MHKDYLSNQPYDKQILFDYRVTGRPGADYIIKDQVEDVKEFVIPDLGILYTFAFLVYASS
jgi:hypothetical protein